MSDTEEGPKTVEQEMDALFGIEQDDSMSEKVIELVAVTKALSVSTKRQKELRAELLLHLDRLGMDAATIAGRKIYKSSKVYYGIDPNMIPAAKAWLDEVAPEMNIPASQKLGKAVEAFKDDNPDAELPDFITSSISVSLKNRKA